MIGEPEGVSPRRNVYVNAFKQLFDELDPLLHERGRLAIVSALAAAPRLTFTELRDTLGMTDGNLSVHLQKLEEKGYVAIDKQFVGRRPQTSCRLTRAGRQAFTNYLDHLEAIVQQVRGRNRA
jgi:DNA-binding MarR family transcriptional regulator